VSCGNPGDETTAASSATAAKEASPNASQPAGVRPRDLSAIDGCEVVKSNEVVSLAGAAKLAAPPTKFPAGCMYVLEMPDGAGESYQVSLQDPALDKMLLEQLTPEDKMEKVAGPWDDARIGPEPLGKGIRMIVLRRDLAIEVAGNRRQPMVEIAKLAAARVR
jgi:hypothetical protein